jgi:tetratricopeptide (TPR) repeat protein
MSRARRLGRPLRLAALVLLGGCVYYNGMYNTNRLAKSARKSEREGRPFEAQGYWGQVITRADSLVLRHPRSKYAEQATVLRGLALARLNQCQDAVEPLGHVALVRLSTDLTEEASLALGRCQLQLGDAGLADLSFARVLNSTDSARRHEARFRHARALRLDGQYEEALTLLRESPDPRARADLLLALAGAGRTDEALVFADSLLALRDSTVAWDSVVAVVGRQSPRAGSSLVSRLDRDPKATPELKARRLYEDGVRLTEVDSAAALARFQQAAEIPGGLESRERARLRLLRGSLSSARSVQELAGHSDSLAALAVQSTPEGLEAAALEMEVTRVAQLDDSTAAGVPQGDLRLFLAAESVRDSIHAPVLAASLFRRLADEWPASPYAPKALLASQRLDPRDPGGIQGQLDSLYHDSPYLAVVRGEEAPGYRQLEDSLQTFAAAQPSLVPHQGAGAARPGLAAPRARSGQRVLREDLVRPGSSAPSASQPATRPDDVPRPQRPTPSAGDSTSSRRRGVEQ